MVPVSEILQYCDGFYFLLQISVTKILNAAGMWIVLASTTTLPPRHYPRFKAAFVSLLAGNNTGLNEKFGYASKELTHEN